MTLLFDRPVADTLQVFADLPHDQLPPSLNWANLSGGSWRPLVSWSGGASAFSGGGVFARSHWLPHTFGPSVEAFCRVTTLGASWNLVALTLRAAHRSNYDGYSGYLGILTKPMGGGALWQIGVWRSILQSVNVIGEANVAVPSQLETGFDMWFTAHSDVLTLAHRRHSFGPDWIPVLTVRSSEYPDGGHAGIGLYDTSGDPMRSMLDVFGAGPLYTADVPTRGKTRVSVREMLDELIGVRLDARNVSLWNAVAEFRDYARIALRDAALVVRPTVQEMYTSGVADDGGIVPLPHDVGEVLRVTRVASTNDPAREIQHYDLVRTGATVFLDVHDKLDGRLNVYYRRHRAVEPVEGYVWCDSIGALSVTGTSPGYLWPAPPNYVEIHRSVAGRELREVARYDAVGPSGFSGLARGAEGAHRNWEPGATVSQCFADQPETRRAIMLLAQAVMYEFFLRDRALYDKYTAIASSQAMSMEELQLLIRDLEGRANIVARRAKGPPQVGRSRLRRPIPE